MNYSMLLYTSKKKKIDQLVKKYEGFQKGRYQPSKILKMQTSRNKIVHGVIKHNDASKSRSKCDSKNSSLSTSKYRKSKYGVISNNTSISCKTASMAKTLYPKSKKNPKNRFKICPDKKIRYEISSSSDQQRGELRSSRNKDFKKSKSISTQEAKFNIRKGQSNAQCHEEVKKINHNKFIIENDKSRINKDALLISASYDESKTFNKHFGKTSSQFLF